jgi:predicted AAA+ superfamily ATPase
MNSRDLVQILLSEFHRKLDESKNSVHRDASFPNLPDKIKVALGMRRVGKTYFLLQNINGLLRDEHITLSQILYLNLEDDRLAPYTQSTLRDLVDAFYSLYPENHDRQCYLFFDEIQNVSDWPILIRRLFDTRKVQIYLTGSSSKLLSKEIHTSLRGRAVATEIWPYSFQEYLHAKNESTNTKLLDDRNRDILFNYLREYISAGGFPEVVNKSEIDSREILQNYVDVVVMRDIVERYGITNISLIKYMVKTLIKNVGGNFSVNKFVNDLKSQGLTTTKNTAHDYLNYIEDA